MNTLQEMVLIGEIVLQSKIARRAAERLESPDVCLPQTTSFTMLLVAIALLKKGMASSDPVLRQLMFSLIKVWSVSGKTQQEFCLEKGLNFGDFGYWFRKYEQVYALPLSIPVSTCEAEGLQAS